MKNTFIFLLVAESLLINSDSLHAQWVPTNLSYHGGVLSLLVDGTNLYAGTNDSGVFLSTDNGTSWTAVNDGLIGHSVLALLAHGTDIFAGTYGGVYRSTNNGTNWAKMDTGITYNDVYALAQSSNGTGGTNLLAAVARGDGFGVFRSTNNGTGWTDVSNGLTTTCTSPTCWVDALAASGGNIFAGTVGRGAFLSTNNGSTWTPINAGLTNQYVRTWAVSGTNVYAGTSYYSGTGGDSGPVFLTTNNGTTWTEVSLGLTNKFLAALATTGANLLAGTAGGGVFRSTNKGASWEEFNAGLTSSSAWAFAVKDTNLFVGSGGVWRRSLADLMIHPARFSVEARWNMISLPLNVDDDARTTLFPGAVSDAFAYEGVYVKQDVLSTGKGFWLKFASSQSLLLDGFPTINDTIDVTDGWNMIGSISSTIATASVSSIPPGIMTSNFFGYEGGYVVTDSIRPFKGYWVKSRQTGKLILSSSGEGPQTSKIRIVATSELPPSPPEPLLERGEQVAGDYTLEQNYPNPFNPETRISFTLASRSYVSLKIFDVLGGEVAQLVSGELPPGSYSRQWNADNRASGVYFYRLQAGAFSTTKKLVLFR